jgi:NAD(P)-dependent dehydrogenase (short-subunit alcohol dehydrogenase family)
MSRPLLSLYRLDRDKLHELSVKLRELLARDDRAGLSTLLGLGEELARRLASERWAVGLMLRPDEDPQASPIFASLRRVAKRAALEHVWTSESPALEGRLRAYDILRDEQDVADTIDRLLDQVRLPWFLQRPGATGGWLGAEQRETLAQRMEGLGPALPDEVNAFVEALGGMDGDALVHDRL